MNKNEEDKEPVDPKIVDSVKDQYFSQLNKKPYESKALDTLAEKAAELCVLLKCDPAIYVAAQIKFWIPIKGHETQFLPNQLAGPNAAANVEQYRTVRIGNTLPGLWTVQKKYLKDALTQTSRSLERILLDKNMDFSPWFRCLITKEAIPSVIKQWGYQASQELESQALKIFLDGLVITEGVTFDYSRIPRYTL